MRGEQLLLSGLDHRELVTAHLGDAEDLLATTGHSRTRNADAIEGSPAELGHNSRPGCPWLGELADESSSRDERLSSAITDALGQTEKPSTEGSS